MLPSDDPSDRSDQFWDDYYGLMNQRNPWDEGISLHELLTPDTNVIIYIQATKIFSDWGSLPLSHLNTDEMEEVTKAIERKLKSQRVNKKGQNYIELLEIIK